MNWASFNDGDLYNHNKKTFAGDGVTVLINSYTGMMPGEIGAATKTNELVVLTFYRIVHYLGNL